MASSIEVFRNRAPDRVLAIYPGDGGSIVRRADNEIQVTAAAPSAVSLNRDARVALRNAPLTPGAVRLLGMSAELRSNLVEAQRLYDLSARVTRRDLQTQLGLIELSVRNGNIAGALRHYDIALRTHASAGELLYPILADAIQDPQVRQPFYVIARQAPSWLGTFLASAIRTGGHSNAVAEVVAAVGGPARVDPGGRLNTVLLQGLAADRDFPALRRFYARMPGADPRALTSIDFGANNIRPDHVPVSWQIVPSDSLQASFTVGAKGVSDLSLSLDPGQEVLVARKLMFLAGGRYRFAADVRRTTWIAESRVRWLAKCALDVREPILWQSEAAAEGEDRMTISGEVSIGTECPVQFLDLVVAAGSEAQQPLDLVAGSPRLVALPTQSPSR